MQNAVKEYLSSKENLFSFFGCDEEYFIKALVNYNWAIEEGSGVYFLIYWDTEGNKTKAVLVKKNGDPLIYRREDFTMVIGIDCVKTAFIFKNAKAIPIK